MPSKGGLRYGRFGALVGAAGIFTSCGLFGSTIGGPPPPSTPLSLPLSVAVPAGDETVKGEMRVVGRCLTIGIRDGTQAGPTILPIWPIGFTAKGGESEGVVLMGPLGIANDAINSELLELHGQYIAAAPPDAIVRPECATYRLFLVGRALNIAT